MAHNSGILKFATTKAYRRELWAITNILHQLSEKIYYFI